MEGEAREAAALGETKRSYTRSEVDELIAALTGILGKDGLISGDDVALRAEGWASPRSCGALLVARPTSTGQVSDILRLCHRKGVEVVPYGGGTGLVQGAIASAWQILLSLERMRTIESFDETDRTAVVEAGVTLQTLQEEAGRHDLFFPLDLGARGSATIGGNIATNAGGNRVVRFGMMRDMVLGLEAVLPDGTVLSSMNRMIKNNSGYDLKQLLIGSEGTLGVVTRAVLRLREKWAGQTVALVSLDGFDDVVNLLKQLDRRLGGSLCAFEVMWREFYDTVTGKEGARTPPLPRGAPYYVLVEALGGAASADQSCFEAALAELAERQRIRDAVVSTSRAQATTIWALRDDVEALLVRGPMLMFDVSLPISKMEPYVAAVRAALDARWPAHDCVVWGHIGDSNLHIWVRVGDEHGSARAAVCDVIYAPLRAFGGAISAEHGIGEEKRDYLSYTRNAEEILFMRKLKALVDPHNIMNPGKIFPTRRRHDEREPIPA